MDVKKVAGRWKSDRTGSGRRFLYGCLTLCIACMFLLISTTPTFAATKNVKSNKTKNVKEIEISNLKEGYTLPLKKRMNLVVITPRKRKVAKNQLIFSSSDKKVITVDKNGKLKAKKKGFSYITVRMKSNKKVKCKVKVFVGTRIRKFQFVRKPTTLLQGSTYQMIVTALPYNAVNKHLEWSSSDPDVATVNPTGLVKAIKPGEAVITVEASDGSNTKISCNVNVIPRISSIKIVYDYQYPYVEKGGSIRLKSTVTPNNTGQKIIWVSSKPDIAKVDSNGNVTGLKEGIASIYAMTEDGRVKSNTIDVNVTTLDKSKLKVIAHRGYMGIAPENSRPAFKLATMNNFDGIECDIFRTSDGFFVVQHDNNLQRLFGRNILISESTYDDIKDLKYTSGNRVENYPNEYILKIESYMSILAHSDKRAVIELKQSYGQEEMNRLFDLISSYGINDRVDIISTLPLVLSDMEYALETYASRHDGATVEAPKFVYVMMNPKDRCEAGNVAHYQYAIDHGYDINCHYSYVTKDVVDAVHKAGLKVWIFTVDNFSLACHYVYDLQVDCITAAYPLYH